jgi:hypothetical protein
MSSPPSVLTPYKAGLFSGKGVIVTGGGTGLGYAIGKSGSCIPSSYEGGVLLLLQLLLLLLLRLPMPQCRLTGQKGAREGRVRGR